MATPRIPRSNGVYRAEIWKSDVKDFHAYMIFNPDGSECCAGRHRGSAVDAERHAQKILDRYNDCLGRWTTIRLPGTREPN